MEVRRVSGLKPGSRVLVPWGHDQVREGVVIELWGDVHDPTQVRVQLDPRGDEDDSIALLLPPAILVLTPAA